MSHTNLQNFLRLMFGMMHHHHYPMDYINDMMIWEKDVYVSLLIEEKNKKNKG